jgi:hypothetical protein
VERADHAFLAVKLTGAERGSVTLRFRSIPVRLGLFLSLLGLAMTAPLPFLLPAPKLEPTEPQGDGSGWRWVPVVVLALGLIPAGGRWLDLVVPPRLVDVWNER